jgi:Uma2 family endonuclease
MAQDSITVVLEPDVPETAPSSDPFPYGSRWMRRRLPSGKVVEEQIPLTAEDLLDPQLDDEIPQTDAHSEFFFALGDLLSRHFASREDIKVAGDLKMVWDIPGVPGPSPDVAVIPGVRKKFDSARTCFDVAREGTRPCLIIEIVSSIDEETLRIDYERKVAIYETVGIPEYIILDPPTPATQDQLLLTGYRLGPDRRYRRIEPDGEGRLLSETTNLLFGAAEDGQTTRVVDAVTGKPILTARELDAWYTREAVAHQAAEQHAATAEEQATREAAGPPESRD